MKLGLLLGTTILLRSPYITRSLLSVTGYVAPRELAEYLIFVPGVIS